MTIVYYVGGSKDGSQGLMPYGLTKLQSQSDAGSEIYVEKHLQVGGRRRLRVMALEGLTDERIHFLAQRHRDASMRQEAPNAGLARRQ